MHMPIKWVPIALTRVALGLTTAEVNAALVSFENHAVVEGWLTKLGRNVQSWKRRWCVLQNNFIVYFKNKTVCPFPPRCQ